MNLWTIAADLFLLGPARGMYGDSGTFYDKWAGKQSIRGAPHKMAVK